MHLSRARHAFQKQYRLLQSEEQEPSLGQSSPAWSLTVDGSSSCIKRRSPWQPLKSATFQKSAERRISSLTTTAILLNSHWRKRITCLNGFISRETNCIGSLTRH